MALTVSSWGFCSQCSGALLPPLAVDVPLLLALVNAVPPDVVELPPVEAPPASLAACAVPPDVVEVPPDVACVVPPKVADAPPSAAEAPPVTTVPPVFVSVPLVLVVAPLRPPMDVPPVASAAPKPPAE